MRDIKPFLCSRKECIERVQRGIDMYSKKELAALIDRHEYLSILQFVVNSVGRSNGDELGEVYLYDELDPVAITEYAILEKGYTTDKELVYSCICRKLMTIINEFYGNLRQGIISYHTGKGTKVSYEMYERKCLERMKGTYKRLRGKAK